MWNMISTSAGGAYDKTPGDRARADDSGRFEAVLIDVVVWQNKVTVHVHPARKASEEDSVKAICIEKAINELFVFERARAPEDPKVKKLTDGKTIDV